MAALGSLCSRVFVLRLLCSVHITALLWRRTYPCFPLPFVLHALPQRHPMHFCKKCCFATCRSPTQLPTITHSTQPIPSCRGDIVIDGKPMPENLMDIVKAPLKANPTNSVVAFKDNSSAIRGFNVTPMLPLTPGAPSPLAPTPRDWDLLLTAETHNFPCAVAPYPGASTVVMPYHAAASCC